MSAKRSPQKKAPQPSTSGTGINPKQPCPCGSGKRYKACHGAGTDVLVTRPFEGLAAEPVLVGMREFVPSALAPVPLAEPVERSVTLATVLPGAAAAVVRKDGHAMIGLQVQTRSGDLSADLGRALRWALDAEPGEVLATASVAGRQDDVVRLQQLLDPMAELEMTLHADFNWWLDGDDDPPPEATAAVEHSNSLIRPTEAIVADGVRGAFWVDTGAKAHLRWVRTEPEDRLMDALARLQAAGELDLGEGSRYVGAFRAHGLLVPVWDLDREQHAKEWVAPAAAFAIRLDTALKKKTALQASERRARDGLAGRQVTLH
ncbi:MAG: FAD-binding 9 siderophore-interacting domain protein [Pseudonocardia sp.]|jgi:hypothetical protein|nr:FAD-binding 9 siderophore-interacting domain protein [Pseudonocardia sp.]